MAILQKDRLRDPAGGFARDLPAFMRALLPVATAKGIRIITNAGGMNPRGSGGGRARRWPASWASTGSGWPPSPATTSPPRLDELRRAGVELRNMDTGADLVDDPRPRRLRRRVPGRAPHRRRARGGADVVVTGRVADASLFLAPMVHELGWGWDDWDRLAAGVVLGHLMECSGQATGGNFSGDWWNIPDLDRIGYPVCEVREDGSALLTKPARTGGRVSVETVAEQLLYEVLDPRAYLNPDVVADFTTRAAGPGGRRRGVRQRGARSGATRRRSRRSSATSTDGSARR